MDDEKRSTYEEILKEVLGNEAMTRALLSRAIEDDQNVCVEMGFGSLWRDEGIGYGLYLAALREIAGQKPFKYEEQQG